MEILKPGLLFRPGKVRQLARENSLVLTGAMNACSGVFLFLALFWPLFQYCTPALVLALIILFGPLLGFAITSSYPRIEFLVAKLLRGKSPLETYFRLFSWSFLPNTLLGLIIRLASLILPEAEGSFHHILSALLGSLCLWQGITYLINFRKFHHYPWWRTIVVQVLSPVVTLLILLLVYVVVRKYSGLMDEGSILNGIFALNTIRDFFAALIGGPQ